MNSTEPKIGWTGWGPREPEPTTLIALWPDGEAPTQTEVLAALAELGFTAESELEALPTSAETLWTAVVRKGAAPPVVVWAEAAQPMTTAELREIGIDDGESAPKWVVAFQCLIDIDDPLPSLAAILRCADAGVADAPALLDVNARRWIPREQLDVMLSEEAPLPPNELLWTIEVVSRGEGSRERGSKGARDGEGEVGGVWLRTQGLARCGRPELEMVEVPEPRAAVAATLLNDVAEFLLEVALPEPGEPLEIGVGLRIALQPWSAVGPFLRAESAGSPADRAARGLIDSPGSPMNDGDMAFICAAEPVGQFRKMWVWPSEVVRRLAEEGAAVYRTTRATERAAALAQHTWPELAMTWSRVRKADGQHRDAEPESAPSGAGDGGGAVVLIKVGFEIVSEDEPAREHLWFMVREIAGDQARGQLINEPLHATSMHEGDEVWVSRAGVSDWRLIMPSAIVQPSDMLLHSPALGRALAALENPA